MDKQTDRQTMMITSSLAELLTTDSVTYLHIMLINYLKVNT